MLLDEIKNDLKKAMQAKEEELVGVLRMLISAIRNKEISLRSGGKAELNDEQVIEVISSEIKKRKDSSNTYKNAGRDDLASKEEKETEILEKYLPEQLSDEEIEKIVKKLIEDLDESVRSNLGRIMGMVMPRVKGKADGARVQAIVKKIL